MYATIHGNYHNNKLIIELRFNQITKCDGDVYQ